MVTTNNINITLLEQSQAQKEVTVNEALAKIDAILNVGAIDKDLVTPPGSPTAGDVYIVATSATGDWAGQDSDITYFDQIWKFIAPNEGMTIWLNDEDMSYSWNGTSWVSSRQNLPILGINTTSDATNKLAVASSAVLFNNVGNGVQVKLNKNAAADTASFLYQTGFSGRAEMGTTGDDDFHFKVSSDGSTWYEALVIDRTSGNIDIKQVASFQGPIVHKTYTVAAAPTASSYTGATIYVSNGAAGSPVLAFSDGTNWLRSDSLAAISAA